MSSSSSGPSSSSSNSGINEYVITANHYYLKQENWDGSYHQAGGITHIGGYARYQPYGYETLLKFDLSDYDITGVITEARVEFNVLQGSSSISNQVILYDQNKGSWDPSTVNYDTFGNKSWTKALGVTQVMASQPGWHSIGGVELVGEIAKWLKNPAENEGLVLTSAFWHWQHYLKMDQARLIIKTKDEGIVGETVESAHARSYTHSFEKGNLIANWSFENYGQQWRGSYNRLHQDDISSEYCENCLAKSGSYVAKGWTQGRIALKPDTEYTLSLYYRGESENVRPRIEFYEDEFTIPKGELSGAEYSNSKSWRYYEMNFTTGSNVNNIILQLYENADADDDGNLYFDDVILEEGEASRSRQFVGESMTFADAFGRTRQVQALVSKESSHSLYVDGCLEDYLLFAEEDIDLGTRTKSVGGNIGSRRNIAIDRESKVTGNISSMQHIQINHYGVVEGDLTATWNIDKPLSVTHTGALRMWQDDVSLCEAVTEEQVNYGSENIFVDYGEDVTVKPGSYLNLTARSGSNKSKVRLEAGVYYFKTFVVDPDVELILDLEEGSIEVYVEDNLHLADRTQVIFDRRNGTSFVKWSTNQTHDLSLGDDSRLTGLFFAPNAKVTLGERAILEGGLYAKSIDIEDDGFLGRSSFFVQPTSSRYAVTASTYDEFGRPLKNTLPFLADIYKSQIITDPLKLANKFYDGSKIVPDAEGYAYSEVEYAPDEAGSRVIKSGSAGKDWRISGENTPEQGYGFVHDLSIPSDILVLENEGGGYASYTLNWAKDVNGNYTLSWENFAGQTIQVATSTFTPDPTNLSTDTDDWSITKYEYRLNGSLKRTYNPKVFIGSDFGSYVVNYNSAGQMTSRDSPDDKGVEKFWYNRAGALRFSQTGAQRSQNEYSFFEYDKLGRLLKTGVQIFSEEMTDHMASKDLTLDLGSQIVSTENFYTSLEDFFEKTGITPVPIGLNNTRGKLVAKIAYNFQTELPGIDTRVATLFSYDKYGRVSYMFKYVGSVTNPNLRWSKLVYEYDELKRVKRKTFWNNIFFSDPSLAQPVTQQNYFYDHLHRVVQITDLDQENIVSFAYDDLGGISDVQLAAGVKISYEKHLKGWTTEIKAIQTMNNNNIFQQNLGYEQEAKHAEAGNYLGNTRFDGAIKQKLTKLTADINNPVQLNAYDYDRLGRLTNTQSYKANNPLDQNGNLQPNLSFTAQPDQNMTSEMDENGRIIKKKIGQSDEMQYKYYMNSYKLSYVTTSNPNSNVVEYDGISRDMSTHSNFVYDDHNRLIYDLSKGLTISYNYDNMPVEMNVLAPNGVTYIQKYIYAPDGNRVSTIYSTIGANSGAVAQNISAKHYINFGSTNFSEIKEDLRENTYAEIFSILGLSSKVGRILPENQKEYFIKDYQGSTIRTVRADGSYNDGFAFQYLPYGLKKDLKVPADGEEVSETYTGKEFDETTMTYYFGARFYDPVLGVWLSPDPARQFTNLYGTGGDFINYIDPNGLWKIGLGIVFGYDSRGGFSLGVGVAAEADIGFVSIDADLSSSKNFQDGSWTYSANSGGRADVGVVSVGGNLGASYNTKTGTTLSYGAEVGAFGVGVGAGGANYWATNGDYLGNTVYAQTYTGAFGARAYAGHEWGFGGQKGRGYYTGSGAFGVYAEYSQNYGFGYGGGHRTSLASYSNDEGFRYIGKAIIDELSLTDDRSELPERGPPCGDDCAGWSGTNYMGQTDDEQVINKTKPVVSAIDEACFFHDNNYIKGEAAGLTGALFNASAIITSADIKLAGRAFASSSYGTAAAFGLIATYKTVSNLIIYGSH
jgi:RHS repeat-associated protein